MRNPLTRLQDRSVELDGMAEHGLGRFPVKEANTLLSEVSGLRFAPMYRKRIDGHIEHLKTVEHVSIGDLALILQDLIAAVEDLERMERDCKDLRRMQ